MNKALAFCLCSVVGLSGLIGCSGRQNVSPVPSISDDAKARLTAPVNCSTAQRDIQILEEEKASVGKRVLSGVRSVLPVSVVAGILMGDYGDRTEVATGQYNADIETHIALIKRTCGLR